MMSKMGQDTSSSCSESTESTSDSTGGGDGRRLMKMESPMNFEDLQTLLQDLENQQWKFSGLTYMSRAIEMDLHVHGKMLGFLGDALNIGTLIGSPWYHHQLMFPLTSNVTVRNPQGNILGMSALRDRRPPLTHLVIHLQRNGVQGKFVGALPS